MSEKNPGTCGQGYEGNTKYEPKGAKVVTNGGNDSLQAGRKTSGGGSPDKSGYSKSKEV